MTMSTPNQPKGERAKLPRARVMIADYDPDYSADVAFQVYPNEDSRSRGHELEAIPVAVIPCRSRQSARQMAKVGAFWQMTEEERVEALARVLAYNVGVSYDKLVETWREDHRIDARRILARIQQGARP